MQGEAQAGIWTGRFKCALSASRRLGLFQDERRSVGEEITVLHGHSFGVLLPDTNENIISLRDYNNSTILEISFYNPARDIHHVEAQAETF